MATKPIITEQFLVTIRREGDIPNLADVIGGRLWSIDKVAPNGVIVERCEPTPVPHLEDIDPPMDTRTIGEALDQFIREQQKLKGE